MLLHIGMSVVREETITLTLHAMSRLSWDERRGGAHLHYNNAANLEPCTIVPPVYVLFHKYILHPIAELKTSIALVCKSWQPLYKG